jgi:hypothetical protein
MNTENGNGKIDKLLNKENKISILQYINTIILTTIGIFAFMIFTTVKNVREDQLSIQVKMETLKTEDLRLKTVQDRNVDDIQRLDARVVVLETNYIDRLKEWIDANYIRKAQK